MPKRKREETATEIVELSHDTIDVLDKMGVKLKVPAEDSKNYRNHTIKAMSRRIYELERSSLLKQQQR